ncbi:hypothetical protein DYBT9275_00659 [Dyadobacter sp. CECT 9275]|uniref:Peptidase M43 pregnancy-associated plasma-A domain-containing protein n=1 Tax=Dyadobacter helix TaxID=2822344 RepID=A0A916J8T7_9BACT|nr:M43 family zinc metalloprotease [Dyadobacter sp. CECT 9275]CAG4991015.1 hypothetical protein DYBT9275_00659 [Dyadobacter sp. CECT 9275]
MNSLIKPGIRLVCLILVIFISSGCEKQMTQPVDDFYRFDKMSRLTIKKPAKTDFFLGIDKADIPLEVTAFDTEGLIIKTPQEAVSFYANENKLVDELFTPDKAGVFRIVGKLAGQVSDTVRLRVFDPASLTLRLTALDETDNQLIANGVDTLGFRIELLYGSEVLKVDMPLVLYVNGKETSQPFSTTEAGEYRFVAKGLGIESNEIVIKAISLPAYAIVRLPVIFHEINRQNLTGNEIRRLTDGMTKAYRNKLNLANGPKDQNATDVYVEFYPATRGLDGNPLSVPGLDRVASQKTSFAQEDTYYDSFNSFWDPEQYLNIWVYPNITGSYANASWAYFGVVTEPMVGMGTGVKGSSPWFPFGIFLNASHLSSTTEEILAHEVGHMFGLDHVFAGNGSSFEPCTAADPDHCSDTPYYDRRTYSDNLSAAFSERFKRTSCAGEQYTSTNFMDYYYGYNNSFTPEQLKRVRHTISYGLWLPTPFNGMVSGRKSGVSSIVTRPANLKYIKPVICDLH